MAGAADVRADSEIPPDVGIPKPEIDVVARPVDTLVKPVSAQHSALGQLAGALTDFNPVLGKLQERFQQLEKVQGTAQAEEAFAKDKGNWDQAVQNGDIPSFLHPYGRMAARERFGRLAGDKASTDIQGDPQYIQDVQNATTMEQYDTAWANARQRWEDKNLGHASHSDPLFQANYQQMMSAHATDQRTKAVGEIEKNYVTLNGQHLGDEVAAHIDSLYRGGSDAATIQSQIQDMLGSSGLPELVQRSAVNHAIDSLARKNEDPGIYALADGLQVKGYDGKLYNMGLDKDMIALQEAGVREIGQIKYTAIRTFNAQATIRKGEALDTLTTDMQAEVQKNPTGQIDLQPFFTRAAASGIPVQTVRGIYKALKAPAADTSAEARALISRAGNPNITSTDQGYVTMVSLSNELAQGKISISDYTKVASIIRRRDKRGGSSRGADSLEGVYTMWRTNADRATSPAQLSAQTFQGDLFTVQNEIGGAMYDAYEQWRESHPDGTTQELNDYMQSTLGYLMDFYAPSAGAGTRKEAHAGQKPYYQSQAQ